MNRYKFLFFVLSMMALFEVYGHESEKLDVMFDFAYPVSIIELIRYDIDQAVFAVNQNDFDNAVSLLEEVNFQLSFRQLLKEEDRQFMQAMLDKIKALIDLLEEPQKSQGDIMVELCEQISNKL